MENIIVKEIRSDPIYRKMLASAPEARDDIYRYEFMQQFSEKWALYHIPLKAKQPGGYDIVMASGMMGYLLPQKLDEACSPQIDILSNDELWHSCRKSVERSLGCFETSGIVLPVREYLLTLTLADPASPYSKLSDDYYGDGGIPGYIFGTLVPSKRTMSRLPVALAHESNHNVRFQFVKWSNDISLGEYMVAEGLAENFAGYLYGRENVGPWVTKTDAETLNEYIKPLLKEELSQRGFDNITSYMYGDEIAKLREYLPVGMPYCAGYACGYHLVKYYLDKTGRSIMDATLLPAQEILDVAADFWSLPTAGGEFEWRKQEKS